MVDFKDVLTIVKTKLPKEKGTRGYWYAIQNYPGYSVRISQPNSFDNYLDIIARVTLLYNGETVWDVLISIETDLNKFINKLVHKLKTHYVTNKEHNYGTHNIFN